MTTTTGFTNLTIGWTAGNRITAAAAGDYAIGNPGFVYSIRFTVTESDTVPSLDPRQADMVPPRERAGLSLVAGDRLWLAADDPRATCTVMVQPA